MQHSALDGKRNRSCFDQSPFCSSQSCCSLSARIAHQRRGYASGGIFTTAEVNLCTIEPKRKQVPGGLGERSRQSHMGLVLPPRCIQGASRFIANKPLAMRAGVVSSVVGRAIPPNKASSEAGERLGVGDEPSRSIESTLTAFAPARWHGSAIC
jgi:hypothetical protein